MLPLLAMYENQVIPKGIKTIIQYYQAKTSTITHQSNTIKYNQSSNISNQIN